MTEMLLYSTLLYSTLPPSPVRKERAMSKLRLWSTMSLDGFVAVSEQDAANPLGVGGMHRTSGCFRWQHDGRRRGSRAERSMRAAR